MLEIEYFYSAHSAFAYLGSRRFIEIAKAANRKIIHKPFDLARGIVGVGSVPTRERPQNHRAYYFRREIDRWSEHRNAPIMDGYPEHHWNDTTLANGMLIAATQQNANIDLLAHALLEGHWFNDANLANKETLVALAKSVNVEPSPLLDAALSNEVAEIYEKNTQEAIERSVFGSPTYFVDGDMFYGQDRLEMVERALRQPYKQSKYV
ncbi:MAG: disulfide bond formation protein DsbA [Rickettsiales bacterium]|nr:disulfide bond formation protein DsbA [Rickettsiales bacterium]|tara:strand:- start:145 stop:768 length:624 start_codon:yes stop_codon:yes gene_type:complete